MSSIGIRLDRLPFSRFHVRLLVMGGLGYLFEATDVAIIAFVLPVLRLQWHLNAALIGVLAAGAAMGGFFGALLAGRLGDVIGRRAVMMWALAVYCIATIASAFVHAWGPFLAWRIIAGAGAYAESAIVAPFLAEFAGPAFRGRYVGALASFFSFGFVLAAVLGYLLVPLGPEAWRYVLLVTALPIVMILWWRRSLPESPRWLASRGRIQEAEAVIGRLEREVEAHRGSAALPPMPETTSPGEPARAAAGSTRVGRLFAPPFIGAMCMALAMWFAIGFAYYAFFNWIPSLLVDRGMGITGSYTYSLALYAAQVPGYLTAAALNDLIGRRAVITLYMLLGALAALALAMASSNVWILLAGCCLSFFMNGSYAGIYAYTPELFPTEARATAQGVTSSLSRIGAVISPISVGYIFPIYGLPGVFGLSAGVLLVGALAVITLGVSTTNRSLEQITDRRV
jgi:putative MFS transporter